MSSKPNPLAPMFKAERRPRAPQRERGRHRGPLFLAALVAIALAAGGVALAQSGGGYDLTWNTLDGGGQTFSEGGGYSLGGTVGQAEAGPALAGGGYTLVGGFWGGEGAAPSPANALYVPLLFRGS